MLVDGNAGDGEGVPQAQYDLFRENLSCPTPQLLVNVAEKLGNTDVILCEKDRKKRDILKDKFPRTIILSDHKEAPQIVNGHGYGIWLGDPCGPASQGLESMRLFGNKLRSDFIVTFNEGFIGRVRNTKTRWEKAKELYLPYAEPEYWLLQLDRKHIARTPLVSASSGFKYRVLVIANWLSDAAKRRPFEVVK